jgi:hypothetical protein
MGEGRIEYAILHVCCPGCQRAKTGSKKYTDIPYVNREVEIMQHIVNDPASSHQAGVYGTANDTAQGVPSGGVEPVPEFLLKCQLLKSKMGPQ